jgi:hypothetical protein
MAMTSTDTAEGPPGGRSAPVYLPLGLLLALGGLVLLDVLALRCGPDSRDGIGPDRPLAHRPR